MSVRLATLGDIDLLSRLIDASVRQLQAKDYSPDQIEGALGSVFGVDRQLILDGSYFVVEIGGALAGCGGWSRRRTLFGADAVADRDDALLTPGIDAAKIRAFFVDPAFVRRGIGARLLRECEAAAAAFGFTDLELGATVTGVPLYTRYGFTAVERQEAPLPNGLTLPIVRMVKSLNRSGATVST